MEEDEAGRLRAFRSRFGRGWDAESTPEAGEEEGREGDEGGGEGVEEESLLDLISGYGIGAEGRGNAKGVREEKVKSGKGKGGQR